MFLLDTNTCIRFLNGRSENIRKNIERRASKDIILCSIVKAELFFGAMKSNNPERNIFEQKLFTDRFISFPFDDNCAKSYGIIRNELERLGTPIGPNDLMIAAIAIANDAILVTHNTKEFQRVNLLKYEDWET